MRVREADVLAAPLGDRLVRPGIGELPVGGVQIGNAAREPLLAGISQFQP